MWVGLISYVSGHIRIVVRAGLETHAGECYAVVKEEYKRLGLLALA